MEIELCKKWDIDFPALLGHKQKKLDDLYDALAIGKLMEAHRLYVMKNDPINTLYKDVFDRLKKKDF